MGWIQFKAWLRLTLPALGGVGLFLSAFIDSSFVPLPLVTDLFLMEQSSRHPMRVLYYATMAAVGSLAGCLWIYWLARKGGQAYYRRNHGHPPGRIRVLVQRFPLASVFLPAIAPFPVPFKPFVVAQGVFQVPVATFVIGTLLGRWSLFFIEAFLGARYGAAAKQLLVSQKWPSIALAIGIVLVFFLVRRFLALRDTQYSQTD